MTDLRATLVVARRELLERVRSKWFVAATLLGPLFMVAMIVVPALIASSSTAGTKVEIVDRSGKLGEAVAVALRAEQWEATLVDPSTPDETELERIRTNQINGFIAIDRDVIANGKVLYRGDNASSTGVQVVLGRSVTGTLLAARASAHQLTEAQVRGVIGAPIAFKTQHTTGDAEGSSGTAAFLIGYFLAFILYMVITLYGVAVMRSVVTEKASRVMELMVAAVKPRSLMGGKILGVGGAGLIQVTVWLSMGALTMAYKDTILGWFGVVGSEGGPTLPPFALTEIAVVLAFFVLGYFFYSAMYAAVGAMVSSEQDTQSVQMPVTMLLVIGVVSLQVVSNAPRGGASTVMSNVPLWSPILMPMRFVLGGATLGEVAISLAILVVSMLLVVRAAAKIYRVGVLMYGKRPSLRELYRWLRY